MVLGVPILKHFRVHCYVIKDDFMDLVMASTLAELSLKR